MAEKEWDKLKNSVALGAGEKPAYIWWGVDYFEPQRQMKGDFQLMTVGGHRGRTYRENTGVVRKRGELVLTNRRIIWLEKKGIVKKDFHAAFDIPFGSILGVSSQGVIPKLVISDPTGRHEFWVSDVGKAVALINRKLREAKNVPAAATRVAQPPAKVLAICPQCRNRIPAESKFCPECGENLQPKKQNSAKT